MPIKPKVRVAGLIRCGACGKRYSNPLSHVCVTSRKRSGRTRLRPKAVVTIGTCGKCDAEFVNPLTHVCTGGGDFRQRAAAERKAVAAAKREAARHEYAECDDKDCSRYPCRVYREGRDAGYGDGFDAGFVRGHAAGYSDAECG